MRVIEPHQLQAKQSKKRPAKFIGFFLVIVISVIAGGYIYKQKLNKSVKSVSVDVANPMIPNTETKPQDNKSATFNKFTGEQFRDLYRSVAYPNTQAIVDPPEITGNVLADKRIRELAEVHGYKMTVIPQGAIVKLDDEPRLTTDNLLQPLAADSWHQLKAAAKKDNIPMSLNAAYRSPEYQRDLFVQRLLANGTTPQQIAQGAGDAAINKTLTMTAVPGYSRHHTGYTVDLWCDDGSGPFVNSVCFKWMNDNNYLHAKEYGWIPSYPAGGGQQGPEPEPWEYVWVGTDNLR